MLAVQTSWPDFDPLSPQGKEEPTPQLSSDLHMCARAYACTSNECVHGLGLHKLITGIYQTLDLVLYCCLIEQYVYMYMYIDIHTYTHIHVHIFIYICIYLVPKIKAPLFFLLLL